MELKDICDIIFTSHVQKINNMDKKNKKFLVMFSGVTGSGKSYLSKRIEEKYQGIRINNDDVRDIIRDKIVPIIGEKEINDQQLLEYYLAYLLQKLPENNGFIVVDSSIDRKLKLVLELANQKGYQTFLIRIDLPKDVLIKQIKQRIEKDQTPFLNDLERQIRDHEEILSEIEADFTISEVNFDKFDSLFEAIDAKMSNH